MLTIAVVLVLINCVSRFSVSTDLKKALGWEVKRLQGTQTVQLPSMVPFNYITERLIFYNILQQILRLISLNHCGKNQQWENGNLNSRHRHDSILQQIFTDTNTPTMSTLSGLHLSAAKALTRRSNPYQRRRCCCSVAQKIHYSWNLCSVLTFCSCQMSVRRFKRRPSLNGSTPSCPVLDVASPTSTWTCGTDACSLNCWRCCQENGW